METNTFQLLTPEKFREMIPEGIISVQRTKGKAPPEQGFAYRLWHLLNWAEGDQFKTYNLGASWISPNEFLLDKQRYGKIIGIQPNTLNLKLRTCKFHQSRQRDLSKTFWKCEGFTKNSTIQDLTSIDNRRDSNDNSPQVTNQAVYLPILDNIRIFTNNRCQSDTNHFKTEAIFVWNDIVNAESNSIWAYPISLFIDKATDKFCSSYNESGSEGNFDFDASQTDFSQYLKTLKLDLKDTAKKMITYVLTHEEKNYITLPEFCKFFARFGPEDSVLGKIHHLLCCSKSIDDWFNPHEQEFDLKKQTSGCYSCTFANCFIIRRENGVTYHIYNRVSMQTKQGFLLDETGRAYSTWHSVFENINEQDVPMMDPSYENSFQVFSIMPGEYTL